MEVLEYLNTYGIEKLVEEFSIEVSIDERFPNLRVLNYNQIDSPKNHPIVRECRSLVVKELLDGVTYSVVSRAFDRFFNQGENETTFKLEYLTIYEKVDGSLISVFYCEPYGWMYRTKSMLMPLLSVQGWDRTWKDLIESALDWDNMKGLDKSYTYIFEVVGRENRVVVNYPEDRAYLLALRHSFSGEYAEIITTKYRLPRKYSFKTTQECMESLKHLPNLEEGYVGYKDRIPVVKVKSLAAVCPEKLESIQKFVEYAVTDNRLEQGLQEVGLDQKLVGNFIGWVNRDINKEEGDVLEENNLSMKDVGKQVSTVARNFYLTKLNEDL